MKFITLAVLASLSLSAFSATSDDLKLRGKVPKKLSILVTADPIAMNLDLETSQTALQVASVNEKSNSNTGYKITADSLYDGKLRNTSDSTQEVTYSMTYDGVAVNLVGSNVVKVNSVVRTYNEDSLVKIAYTGVPHEDRVEGNYTDTITFTISAN